VAEKGELIYPSEDQFEEEKPFVVGLALFFSLFLLCVLLPPPGRCREGFRSLQKGRWKQEEEEHLTHLGVLGAFLVFFCFFFVFLFFFVFFFTASGC
jgi:ABC-type Fe3+ transport system permease subunit